MINNAATNPYFGPMVDVDVGAYDKTFDVNTRGYFELARHAAKRFVAHGKPGSIANVASVAAIRGAPLQGVYAMTKAAVVSMTQTLATELGPRGIRVNAIAPGLVDTNWPRRSYRTRRSCRMLKQKIPLQRYAQPDEMAGAPCI